MAIKEELFAILYSVKRMCTKKGDSCTGCPFQNDKGCELKGIVGTYPIAWKELKDDQPDNKGS